MSNWGKSITQWVRDFGHEKKVMELDEQSFRYLLCAFGNFTGHFTGTDKEIETISIYKFPIEAQFFGRESTSFMKLLKKHSLAIFVRRAIFTSIRESMRH